MPAPIPRRRLSPHRAAAAALTAACLAVNVWYIGEIRTPPSFDDAWYLENSFRFYHALRGEGLIAFAKEYAASFRFKAPLISILPLPFYFLLGPSPASALLVNLAALLLLAFCMQRLGEKLGGPRAGLLAVAVAMTLPLLYGLSRKFMVEYCLAALASAWVLRLCSHDAFDDRRQSALMGVLLGAGLLLKSIFPFYVLGPTILALRRGRLRGLKTTLYVGGAIALTWYGPNLVYVAGYVVRASFGDIAAHYGNPLSGYLRVVLRDALSPYYSAVALALGAWALRRRFSPIGLDLLWAWLLPPVLLAAATVNKDVRFLAPVMPAFCLLLARGLDLAVGKRPALAAAFFLVPALQYGVHTFGSFGLPVRLFPERGNYLSPPLKEGLWGQEELVSELARTLPPGSVVAIGLEHPRLNANNLACLAAQKNLSISFVSYGYEETKVERTVARLREKNVDCLLRIEGVPEDEVAENVRLIDAQLVELIAGKRLPFRRLRRLRLTPEISAILYERTAPIRMIGASASPQEKLIRSSTM